MKMVVAMIRPHKLDEIKEGLSELGVQGMSVTEIKGYGRTHGQSETYRGSAYNVSAARHPSRSDARVRGTPEE